MKRGIHWEYRALDQVLTVEAAGERLTGIDRAVWREYYLAGRQWSDAAGRVGLDRLAFHVVVRRVQLKLGLVWIAAGLDIAPPRHVDAPRKKLLVLAVAA